MELKGGRGGLGRCHAGELARWEQDEGWEQAGQEVSPGPIKRVCSARRVYGSRGGWRLGQGALCWVSACGRSLSDMLPWACKYQSRRRF